MRIGSYILGVFMMSLVMTQAVAGEINATDGVAISGYDPVAYFKQEKPVKGSKDYSVTYKNALFLFESASNRDTFQSDPEKYAPQYGGYCAFGTSSGYKAPIDPSAFTITGGKLYLNYDATVQQTWRQDMPGYIQKADENWPVVKIQ